MKRKSKRSKAEREEKEKMKSKSKHAAVSQSRGRFCGLCLFLLFFHCWLAPFIHYLSNKGCGCGFVACVCGVLSFRWMVHVRWETIFAICTLPPLLFSSFFISATNINAHVVVVSCFNTYMCVYVCVCVCLSNLSI